MGVCGDGRIKKKKKKKFFKLINMNNFIKNFVGGFAGGGGGNTKFCELSENIRNVYTVFLRGICNNIFS